MLTAPGFPAGLGNEPGPPPALSVIVAAYRPGPLLAACLTSLRAQQTSQRFEVIIVLSGDEVTNFDLAEYDGFRWVRSSQRMYCGEARNRGIEAARGRIIAFLDADCSVLPDWVDSILEAHKAPQQLIGGSILNGAPQDPIAWAYYFCEFNLWLPGVRATTEMDEMAGCCLSMKREAFEAFGPFLEGTYCSDSAFQWKLNRAGHRVLASPSIRVFHTASYGLRSFLEHTVEHRCCFARVCLREGRVSRRFAHLWLVLAPFLPFLLLAAISWRVVRSGGMLVPFLRSLPWVAAGCVARAFGEVKGVWREVS